MKINLFILMTLMSFLSCKPSKDLPTVSALDVEKYSGTWYEIARLPNSFEKGLECITATYTPKSNGKIEVVNKGVSANDKTKASSVKGVAWVPNSKYPGRLKVRFFWPFSGKYWVIDLDKDYQYALVGHPNRKYLWILSRKPNIAEETYQKLIEQTRVYEFNTSQMISVKHHCE